jgi:hypothetical protein
MMPIFFQFEQDFVEEALKCIPMAVRFKLDACGIKLKLSEWSHMSPAERDVLSTMPCKTKDEALAYRQYLQELVRTKTGSEATDLPRNPDQAWTVTEQIPDIVVEKLRKLGCSASVGQWQQLTDLQRFSILKLCPVSHESKNFVRAAKEFGLIR